MRDNGKIYDEKVVFRAFLRLVGVLQGQKREQSSRNKGESCSLDLVAIDSI